MQALGYAGVLEEEERDAPAEAPPEGPGGN